MASLIPCSQCLRHVRREEPHCPFCGAARAPSAAPAREAPRLREAKRATLIALGLTLAGQACGGKEDEGKKRDDVGLVPPYGIGPDTFLPDGGSGGGGSGGASGSSGEGGDRSFMTTPPYGRAPIPVPEGGSGGTDSPDGGSPDDAGSDDAGVDPDAAG